MVQAPRRLGLLVEPRFVFRPFGLGQGSKIDGLDRDGALDERVVGFVNDAHGASPQLFSNLISPEVAYHFLTPVCPETARKQPINRDPVSFDSTAYALITSAHFNPLITAPSSVAG
jgi:hypothetical protein